MAPSLRAAAPAASRSSRSGVKKSRVLGKSDRNGNVGLGLGLSLGRVTKRRAGSGLELGLGLKVKGEKILEGGCAAVVEGVVKSETVEVLGDCEIVENVSSSLFGSKRKRDESESESENGYDSADCDESRSCEESRRFEILSKKPRLQGHAQLLSPPASRDGTDCEEIIPLNRSKLALSPRSRRVNAVLPPQVELSQSLRDLMSMHAAFLKALSLHYAHNGSSTPAELGALMDSMTRLWKKQTVRADAVRRMLGLYEIIEDSTLNAVEEVVQKNCPFRIVTSGLGLNVRTNLEYVGKTLFSEATLQATFSDRVHTLSKKNINLDDINKIPLLTVALGTQTSLHRAKAASTRAEILNLSTSAQSRSTADFSKLSISEPSDHTPAAIKSRTLSLFDRVRAKGLALANNTAPTAEQITRQHAMGRISEVVDFLRMKQHQKLSAQFQSSVHDSPGKTQNGGKVSFSLGAIVRDIRQSVAVPMGEEEVRVCLRILGKELSGDWCRLIEMGSVVSVTLQGRGPSGPEVKQMLEKPVSRIYV